MNRPHVLVAVLCLIFSTTFTYAQSFQNVPLFIRSNTDNINQEEGHEIFRVRNAWLNHLKNGTYDNIKITIPNIEGSQVVELSKKKIAPDEGIKVVTASGSTTLVNPGQQYFGRIAGSRKGAVVLSIFENDFKLFIQNNEGANFTITDHPNIPDRYLYSNENESQYEELICGAKSNSNSIKSNEQKNTKASSACTPQDSLSCNGMTTLHVFYEMDFLFYLDENESISDCISFMIFTHAVVNFIFGNIQNVNNNVDPLCPYTQINSGGIDLLISSMIIWDHPDPYPKDLDDRLDMFQNLRPSFNGDVAHLVTKGTVDSGGIASIDTSDTSASLCDTSSTSMFTAHSLSILRHITDTSNVFSYGTAIIAHEIGHTLGGRHTFECYWYSNTAPFFSIEDASCTSRASSSCVGACTITSNYEPTIMSYCWATNSPDTTIDYSNPFHREVALDILENLCGFQSCYIPNNCVDSDFDGYCNDDPLECDTLNPNYPAIIGAFCSDNNLYTVNDTIVDDGDGDNLSCDCMGTLWSNPIGETCNLIIGGELDFEDNYVGSAEGTWYGGLQTGWTTSPGNTPDIGNTITSGTCNQFIGFVGQMLNNAIPPRPGIKEGIAIALSDPIPCNVGRFELSLDYCLINVNDTIEFTGNLVSFQGSDTLEHMMPHDCAIPNSNIVCFGTGVPVDTAFTYESFGPAFNSDSCQVTNFEFKNWTETIVNDGSIDLNFIYMAFNISGNTPPGLHNLFIDNVNITMLPDSSYAPVTTETEECDILSISYSAYCDYELQYNDGDDWVTIPHSDLNITLSTPTVVNGFKLNTDLIEYNITDCFSYRVVQNCPPDGAGDLFCSESAYPLDLSDCDNDLEVKLYQASGPDPLCADDEVIIYDPALSGNNALWSNGDETATVQNTFSESVPGTYNYAVTVTDDSGCTGTDDIDVTYEDCPPPMLEACGTIVNYIIDHSFISQVIDDLPHTIIMVNAEPVYVIENLIIFFDNNMRMNHNVIFKSCTIYSDDLIVATQNLHLDNCIVTGCTSEFQGIIIFNSETLIIENGSELHGPIRYEPTSTVLIDDSEIIVLPNEWGCIQANGIAGNMDVATINVTNSVLDGGVHGFTNLGGNEMLYFDKVTITNSEFGISANDISMAYIENCTISCPKSTIIGSGGEFTIRGSHLTTASSSTFNFSSTLRLSETAGIQVIDNNIIEQNVSGTALHLEANINAVFTITDNDIIGGGTLGFLSASAAYSGGNHFGSLFESNVIIGNNAAGVENINTAGLRFDCNDISSSGNAFSVAIYNGSNSDECQLIANTLSSYLDLYTESTVYQVDSDGDGANDHLGNCFEGGRAEANGFSDQDIVFLGMTFEVDGDDNPCYYPPEHEPNSWFRVQPGDARSCSGQPGSGNNMEVSDTTKICRYLDFLNGQLQDSTRRDLAIMRLISLFRMYHDTTITEDLEIPECLKIYIDTTTICGIKMLLTMDSLVTTATLGSDTLRFEIQVQSTLTYLTMLQWRNGAAENRDSLRQLYLIELEKLKTLIQIKQSDKDRIWSEIDSIEIIECLDSISMIEILAYKYMVIKSLTEHDRQVIVTYARRCAKKYGRGIHLMRAMASAFSDEDYRKFDVNCGEAREAQLEKRQHIIHAEDISIVPNPSSGQILVSLLDPEIVSDLYIHDILGHCHYAMKNIKASQEFNIIDSGVYILTIAYKDGSFENKKFLILE